MKKKYDYNAYRAKFAKRNKSYCFNLDKTEDSKLIEWLDAAHNKSKTISYEVNNETFRRYY